MNAKKIITLITAMALILSLAVVPVSADIDTAAVSFEIVEGTGIVGQNIDVVVKMTGSVSLFNLDLGYNPEYLTYVSAATCNATVTATAGGTEEEPVITLTRQESYALDLDDATLATLTFTALSREDFAALEVESVTAEFTFAPQQAPAGGDTFENDLYPGLGGVGFADEALSYTLGTIVISLPPTAPEATAVTILKDDAELEAAPMVGETLAVDYDYSDVNGDEEDGTTIQWYADEVAIEDATEATYTLTSAELGKAITVGVTPANAEEKGDEGVEATSEATEAVAVNPALKATIADGTITITPDDKIKVGKEVVVSYELVSPNGGEDESTIVWTDTESNALAGEVSADGKTFTPAKDDKDKFLKVTVTPKDSLTEANEEGTVSLESVVAITKASSNVSAFVPNSGGTLVQKTEEPTETTTPTDEVVVSGIEKFTDVPADAYAWAIEGIDELVKAGVIAGVTETTFEPETKTTRAHFVAMVMRAVEAVDENAVATYADLAEDHWGYAEIASAQALGALDILGETFDGDKVITREEMASVLYEVAAALEIELPAAETAEEFSDAASIADAAKDAVAALQQAGILHGMGDGTFMPKGETTRAQAAKVVHLLWKLA